MDSYSGRLEEFQYLYLKDHGEKAIVMIFLISFICCSCALMEMIFFVFRNALPILLSDSSIFFIQSAIFMTAASCIANALHDKTLGKICTYASCALYILSALLVVMAGFSAIFLNYGRNALPTLYLAVPSAFICCFLSALLHVSDKAPLSFEHFFFGKRYKNLLKFFDRVKFHMTFFYRPKGLRKIHAEAETQEFQGLCDTEAITPFYNSVAVIQSKDNRYFSEEHLTATTRDTFSSLPDIEMLSGGGEVTDSLSEVALEESTVSYLDDYQKVIPDTSIFYILYKRSYHVYIFIAESHE